jgi:hypothetical protein
MLCIQRRLSYTDFQVRRLFGFFLCSCVSLAPLAAQVAIPGPGDGIVLISTDPLGTTVVIDGNTLPDLSPTLIRGVEPGQHDFVLVRPDYRTHSFRLLITGAEITVVHINLDPLRSSSNPNAYQSTGQIRFRLPGSPPVNGTVDYTVHPAYPRQKLLSAVNISIPLLAAAAGLLTANDMINDRESGLFFSPATLSAYYLTIGAVGIDVALRLDKRKLARRQSQRKDRRGANTGEDPSTLYAEAEDLMAQESFDQALYRYGLILTEHQDTVYYPRALYRAARVYSIRGETVIAEAALRLLVEKHPLPDVYDRASKALADLLVKEGRDEEAISILSGMLFIDPIYTEETIEDYIEEIRVAPKA